jgi:hypothetical protein
MKITVDGLKLFHTNSNGGVIFLNEKIKEKPKKDFIIKLHKNFFQIIEEEDGYSILQIHLGFHHN